MRTMRDFKEFVANECFREFPLEMEAYRAFWDKLNRIGARNIETHPPSEYPDIDATVELSEAEWCVLEAEFRAL